MYSYLIIILQQETCHSVLELQSCDLLFECHPWIPLKECQDMCDQIPPLFVSLDFYLGHLT